MQDLMSFSAFSQSVERAEVSAFMFSSFEICYQQLLNQLNIDKYMVNNKI